MLLYDAVSPAPRCLRMFVLEKGLQLPTATVDLMTGENRKPGYLAINPAGQAPALRLDDGRVVAEGPAIAEYLEELHPRPPLLGATPEQRAETRMWWRRIELNVTEFIHNAYHYSEGIERFQTRIPVLPEAANGMQAVARNRLRWLDGMLGKGPYICDARLSAADIWLYVWLDFGAAVGQPFDRTLPKIGPWFERIAARPSAARSRELL